MATDHFGMRSITTIQMEDLTKFFGDFCAVNGLNIEADKEIFGLLGPNGSGKTTTVLMLTTIFIRKSS